MGAVNRKIIAQATLMIMSSMLLPVGHIYGLLLIWKMKMKLTEIILCFIFNKNETIVVPKKSLEKLEISIVKREAAGIFLVGMMFSGEVYDKAFYQMILGKKNLRMPKGDFEGIVAELRPNIFTKSFIL